MNYIRGNNMDYRAGMAGKGPKRSTGYTRPKMDHYTEKELKQAIRAYERALKNCKAELQSRYSKRNKD